MEIKKQIEIIRGLAAQYQILALSDENIQRRERCKSVNDLKPMRPPVWIDEVPWHEMNFENRLTLLCSDPLMVEMEWFFREKLFRWEFFKADMVLSPYYPVSKSCTSTGMGVEIKEDTIATDSENSIVSHSYIDELDTEEKLNRLLMPKIVAQPEKDHAKIEKIQEILGDIMAPQLCGATINHCPWDTISMLRGVEPALIDIMERPEFIHETMERFTQIGLSIMEQYENQGLLSSQVESVHCTPGFTDSLPQNSTLLKDVWFRGMAQMFSTVSPATFEEFEFNYMKRLAEKCGLVYYGCCEPLDNFFPVLKKLPNLRKLGVSPWSNVRKAAEELGGNYVYARKPNPAFVGAGFDEDTVRKEITETVKACIENKCPYEFVLKDISTVNYKPQNLFNWSRIVQETLDEFY